MTQKGFKNILLILLVVALFSVAGYLTLVKKTPRQIEITTSAPTSTLEQQIGVTITSPRAGQSVAVGSSLLISWSSTNTPQRTDVLLRLIDASTGKEVLTWGGFAPPGMPLFTSGEATGSFNWPLRAGDPSACPTTTEGLVADCPERKAPLPGKYKIRVELHEQGSFALLAATESAEFTITK